MTDPKNIQIGNKVDHVCIPRGEEFRVWRYTVTVEVVDKLQATVVAGYAPGGCATEGEASPCVYCTTTSSISPNHHGMHVVYVQQ